MSTFNHGDTQPEDTDLQENSGNTILCGKTVLTCGIIINQMNIVEYRHCD